MGTSNPPTFGAKVAIDWDGALLNLSPLQFGTTAERNYRFYSIVGMAQKDPNMPLEPWHFSDPITASKCPQGSVAPGTGYQWLSKGTEGLRYPICPVNNVQDFSAVFKDIAAGVVSGTKVPCEFDLPDPPPGQSIDYDKIALTFTPSMGPPKVFSQVPDSSACSNDDDKFYIEGSKIILCDEACKLVTSDDSAKIDVNIPCDAITS